MTKKKELKKQTVFVDKGFGFNVRIKNPTMTKVRGVWTPKINYNKLAKEVLFSLCNKEGRLTGSEIRFIRQHFEMGLQKFADLFCVTHVAVMKWEKAKNTPTAMAWTTEKDLRLFVLSKLKASPTMFTDLYAQLEKKRKDFPNCVDIEAKIVT